MPEEHRGGAATLAEKLTLLFDTIRPPGRDSRYTDKEVAALINARATERGDKISISNVYIWQLRTGRRQNPTLEALRALAEFFDVPAAYFVDDNGQAARIHQDLLALNGMQRLRLRGVAARVAQLPDQGLDYISEVIKQVDEALIRQRRDADEQSRANDPSDEER
jgi:transcriptional regulator with XRE-family HTH domain